MAPCKNVREGRRDPWQRREEVWTVLPHSTSCSSYKRRLSRMHMDCFTKAPVMKHHLLHSSGDLLNHINSFFFPLGMRWYIEQFSLVLLSCFDSIHSVGQCLRVDLCNRNLALWHYFGHVNTVYSRRWSSYAGKGNEMHMTKKNVKKWSHQIWVYTAILH